MHRDTFKTIQMWLFMFTKTKSLFEIKKTTNKQNFEPVTVRQKAIKLRGRYDKTRKAATTLADKLNTRDTVSVIWRRRQQISEDDFQLNPQELWSWVRRLNFPRVCQKRGQKRRYRNFLVFPEKKKLIELRWREEMFKMSLWTLSKCSHFWSGNKVLSW